MGSVLCSWFLTTLWLGFHCFWTDFGHLWLDSWWFVALFWRLWLWEQIWVLYACFSVISGQILVAYGFFGALWLCFVADFGVLWAEFGASWTNFGALWGILVPCGQILVFCGCFCGGVWTDFGTLHLAFCFIFWWFVAPFFFFFGVLMHRFFWALVAKFGALVAVFWWL